jgi:hypothetical protein
MTVSLTIAKRQQQRQLGPSHQHSSPPASPSAPAPYPPSRGFPISDQTRNCAEGGLRGRAGSREAQYRLVVLLEDEDGFAELGHERCQHEGT